MMDPNAVLIVVQARMGSSRLPGKALLPLGSSTLIGVLIRQLEASGFPLCIAIPEGSRDDILAKAILATQTPVFRGDEQDVLGRIWYASQTSSAQWIVRICADSPYICPETLKQAVSIMQAHPQLDILSTHPAIGRTFPLGLGIEVMTRQALQEAFQKAKAPEEREHVTPYLTRNAFQVRYLHTTPILAQLRITVDTPEDYTLLQKLATYFTEHDIHIIALKDIEQCAQTHPDWFEGNAHIQQVQV
jgi:spore coat polysaccharide biosynthesis protein SpsF